MTTYIQRKQSWGSNILALGVITTHKNSVHSTPLLDYLFTSQAGRKSFSKVDLTHAYQQVLLDDDSGYYVTVNTHK